jgi:uncharacterized protein (DUF2132 family)
MDQSKHDPLHGKTLEHIVTTLVERYGWEELAAHVNIRCFTHDPSVKSSLVFLRKTPWARNKVEQLYLTLVHYGRGTARPLS